MTLYEIDSAIMDCVDEETGEIIDLEKLEALNEKSTFPHSCPQNFFPCFCFHTA